MPKVTKRSYGDYVSSNYGAHSLQVDIGDLTLYFSYETVIAFFAPGLGLVIRVNDWGNTTGKHLNWIDPDKSKRIPGPEFEAKLDAVLQKYGLTV